MLGLGSGLVHPGLAHAAVDGKPQEDPPGDPQSQTDEGVAQFEVLQSERAARLQEVAALELDAQTAIGNDQLALQGQALELRLEEVESIRELGSLIEEIESRGANASEQRQILITLLTPLPGEIQSAYAREQARLDRMKTERQALTDPEAAAAFDAKTMRQDELGLRILGAAIDLVDLTGQLDLAVEADRSWLEERVLMHARLAASHVNLARHRLGDLVDRSVVDADPAAQQAAEAAMRQKLQWASQSLNSVVDLMDRLEIDASGYHQILIESTGELTVEALDPNVAGEILSRWAADTREGIVSKGPGFAFQALLFAFIITIFWGLSRFVRKILGRLVAARHLRFSELLGRMIVSMGAGAVLLAGLLVALSQLGIEVAPMLAGLGIAGFVLGFALQDTLANFAAGVMILIYRPYDVEDMIDCAGGVFGRVSQMSLVSTTILTIDNKTLVVPNGKIWGDVITNVTAQEVRRVDLEFGIGYQDDIPHAEEVLWSVLKDHPKVKAEPEPIVKVHALGDSSVNFVVRPWVARDDYWDVYWDVTREVKLRFDREGVSIPFPQRDVHIYPAGPAPQSANE
jgi:small conductance mechanosensitive channel